MLSSRMAGLLLDRPRLVGHLRPDSLPVLGPKISARNGAIRGKFNRSAMLDRDRSTVCSPLVDKRWGHAHTPSKRRSADRSVPIEVIVQIHGFNYSVATVYSQAML